jgi:hypothetical protein
MSKTLNEKYDYFLILDLEGKLDMTALNILAKFNP